MARCPTHRLPHPSISGTGVSAETVVVSSRLTRGAKPRPASKRPWASVRKTPSHPSSKLCESPLMQIHKPALQRVKSAPFRADGIAQIFEHMVEAVKQFGPVAGEFTLLYQKLGDPVEEGDLVPYITI